MPVANKNIFFILGAIAAVVFLVILYFVLSPPKNYVIGYINPNPTEFEGAQGFLRNLPKYGYIEGQNTTLIKIETKDKAAIDKGIRDMVKQKADLIFTMTTPATKMAKKITQGSDIPVVFILYDAIRSDIIESLLKHEGNLTGVQLRGSTPKALEKLLEISPNAKHILTPVCYDTGAAKRSLEDLKISADRLGLELTVVEVNSVEELQTAILAMPEDVDALFVLHTWLVGTNLEPLINESIKRKIPLLSAGHVHYDSGLLFSYGPRDEQTGAQVARLANNILVHGIPPSDLPVETSDFFLGINLKTAAAAEIEIPYNLLQQADFIIR